MRVCWRVMLVCRGILSVRVILGVWEILSVRLSVGERFCV